MVKDIQKTSWGRIKWIHRPEDNIGNMSIGIVTVNPNTRQLEHVHFSDEQCLIALQGEGLDYINGSPVDTDLWGASYFPVGSTHFTENNNDEPLVQLLVSCPIGGSLSYNKNFDEENLHEEIRELKLPQDSMCKYIKRFVEEFDWDLIIDTEFPLTVFSQEDKLLAYRSIPEGCHSCSMFSEENMACTVSLDHYLNEVKGRKPITFDTIICPRERLVIIYEIIIENTMVGYIQGGYFEHYSDLVDSTLDGIIQIVMEIAKGIKYECKDKMIKYALEDGSIKLADEAEKNTVMEIALEKSISRILTLNINNHFLFNTLTAIAALAMKDGSARTYDAILDLSAMFRGKLQKAGSLVDLEFDMENIKTYISLMKLRFYNEVKTYVSVPEDCRKLKIPYNLIQPIVENSLIHGFKQDFGKPFVMKIACRRNEKELVFIVEDNGVGMDPTTLKNLRDSAISSDSHGLGMVHILLKQVYKEGFRVSVHSEIKRGTKFTITVPII